MQGVAAIPMLLRQQLLRFPVRMRLAAAPCAPCCGCGRSLSAASQVLLRLRPHHLQQQQQQLLEAKCLGARPGVRQSPRRGMRLMPPVCMGRRSSKIATRKNAQDQKRAKVWGALAKKIIQAAKAGGPDVAGNQRLAEVIKAAKAAEVPRDIIDRNLKKATDKGQADYAEVTYEAYGAGGTGFIMECLTDNVNRSATDVRTAVTKAGGKMADSGSVLFNFRRQGQVYVRAAGASEEQVMDAAMEAGAEDVQTDEGEGGEVEGFKVLTTLEDFAAVRDSVLEQGLAVDHDNSGPVYLPLMTIEVDDAAFAANEAILERLLAVDDVDSVHTNCAGLQT